MAFPIITISPLSSYNQDSRICFRYRPQHQVLHTQLPLVNWNKSCVTHVTSQKDETLTDSQTSVCASPLCKSNHEFDVSKLKDKFNNSDHRGLKVLPGFWAVALQFQGTVTDFNQHANWQTHPGRHCGYTGEENRAPKYFSTSKDLLSIKYFGKSVSVDS